MLVVSVPIPPKELNPNSRTHWARKSAKVKEHKAAAFWATRAAIFSREGQSGSLGAPWDRVSIRYCFYHSTKHQRDDDNLIASMKAARDGLVAGGLLRDDYRVTLLPIKRGIDPAHPRVDIEVERT